MTAPERAKWAVGIGIFVMVALTMIFYRPASSWWWSLRKSTRVLIGAVVVLVITGVGVYHQIGR